MSRFRDIDWRAALVSLESSRSAALVPVAVAVFLGLFAIGDKSMWLDEAFSISLVKMPTVDMLVYLWRNELHASPYYLLLHPWSWLGYGEVPARALSVLIGAAGVAATYAVGRRYGVGFRAALLLAIFPTFVQFEQEARGYTLLVASSALTTLAYLRLVEQPGKLRAAAYAATAATMIYVHPLGALVIVAHALHAAVGTTVGQRRLMTGVYAAVLVGWLPMFRFALLNRGKISWIPPLSVSTATAELVALAGGTAVAAVVVVLVALRLRRDVPGLWLTVPIFGALLISAFVQPILQAKYLIAVLPAMSIVAAQNRLRGLAVLVIVCLIAVSSWYTDGEKDDWRSAAAWIGSQAEATDGVVFSPHYARLAFEYYGEIGVPLYPSVAWDQFYMPAWGLDIGLPPDADRFSRIWLIEAFGFRAAAEVWSLLSGYDVATSRDFGRLGPWVRLMVRRSSD